MLRSAFPVLAVLGLIGCRCGDTSPPASKPELEGLRSTVVVVRRPPSLPPIEVTYVLEWTGRAAGRMDSSGRIEISGVWVLEPLEPAVVHFWDATGKLLGETMRRIDLPDRFMDRSMARHEARFFIDLPVGATSLSVALGNSGLESDRVAAP